MNLIAETAARRVNEGRPFVLATIVNREGSAPRTAGTRMIINPDGPTVGTIGGGLLEARVIQKAGEVLVSKRPQLVPFDMTHFEVSAMDMICGGRLEVLLEFIDPSSAAASVIKGWQEAQSTKKPIYYLTVIRMAGEEVGSIYHCLVENRRVICGDLPFNPTTVEGLLRETKNATSLQTLSSGASLILIDPVFPAETVFLFGAGHVAQPTARLAAFVGFRVWVLDDRPEFANRERFPGADEIRVVAHFESSLKGLAIDGSAYVVIVTRGHLNDKTVLMQALQTEATYIGMIGSRRKRDHIFNALLKQGFTEADLKRVRSPIGLDIGAETPEEIALSIVSELVQTRAQRRLA
jgi:xanthine dehydrogenase accessory factor